MHAYITGTVELVWLTLKFLEMSAGCLSQEYYSQELISCLRSPKAICRLPFSDCNSLVPSQLVMYAVTAARSQDQGIPFLEPFFLMAVIKPWCKRTVERLLSVDTMFKLFFLSLLLPVLSISLCPPIAEPFMLKVQVLSCRGDCVHYILPSCWLCPKRQIFVSTYNQQMENRFVIVIRWERGGI